MASKSSDSSSSGGELSGDGGRESYTLKQLHTNKLSHKIAKPPIRKPAIPSNLEPHPSNLTPPTIAAAAAAAAVEDQNAPPQQPPQPPVYNISKSDFRDVVQRLTGAPPHDPPALPPPVQPPPRPPTSSSRLHRIRPPPLAQLTTRPPPMIHCAMDPVISTGDGSGNPIARPGLPMSPLPPLPGVHLAAESPVSAYMRRLRSSSIDSRLNQPSCLSPLAPPRWCAEQGIIPPGAATASQSQGQLAPSSPLPYRLIPPVTLFPPTSPSQLMGYPFPQLPHSPTVPSPKP